MTEPTAASSAEAGTAAEATAAREAASSPEATAAPEAPDTVLEVRDLTVDLRGAAVQPGLVREVSFRVRRGGATALIGESGCGKTMTAMSLLGLLPREVRVSGGSAVLEGTDLLGLSPRQLARARGRRIGAVFQEPMSTLDPTMTVGDQIGESRRIHLRESRSAARVRARELLELVGIPNAAARLRAYPHELSGGMQQRVGIAAAIACDPPLLIADEPTTALDVTIQAEILDLLRELRREQDLAVLLVTHDLGVVADFCDEVVVMYAGGVAETAGTDELFGTPRHPYTSALIASVPTGAEPFSRLTSLPGRVPAAGSFPAGCRFAARCPFATDDCTRTDVYHDLATEPTRCLRVVRGEITPEAAA
ncbi:ABC transporter ATP-binding protein [Brevibacterium album]|uniref:ABC transporter ATP-binding protein n=1 Tax=Brevibacterium album TaxID=417948 RepID=UPI000416D649|nr:ABC transporter ATP-binding protein [Brevibacterium album]